MRQTDLRKFFKLAGFCLVLSQPLCAHAVVIIGQNFTGSTLADSGFIPPDTMGAVGPEHFVELLNGRYSVYNKRDARRVQASSLNQFWANAGVTPAGPFAFDPRIIFDRFSSRWFAVSADNSFNDNNFLLAVSNGSNPTQGWRGFAIDSDSANLRWADYPTLGVNRDGVYLSADMRPIADRGAFGLTNTIVTIPKADLLASTPSIANTTKFENNSIGATGFTVQPAVDLNNGPLPAVFLSSPLVTAGNPEFRRSNIVGDIRSPILDTSGVVSVTPFGAKFIADQPALVQGLEIVNGSILHANVVIQENALWGVQTVLVDSRAALRWFQIDLVSNVVLQEGLITQSGLDFYYGSIAVNEFSDVVIGFSGSGTSQFVSSYAAVGQTVNGRTIFDAPILLQEGVATYFQTFGTDRNRWGDYSATTLDPSDPFRFWTIQEWVSAPDTWATQITELIVSRAIPEPSTFLLLISALVVLLAISQFDKTRIPMNPQNKARSARK